MNPFDIVNYTYILFVFWSKRYCNPVAMSIPFSKHGLKGTYEMKIQLSSFDKTIILIVRSY